MKKIFTPGWVSCLDESMSIWHNRWTCSAWIMCPRKPNPFGMEWNDIACGLSGIIFGIELRGGKDKPEERANDPTNEKGKVRLICVQKSSFILTN